MGNLVGPKWQVNKSLRFGTPGFIHFQCSFCVWLTYLEFTAFSDGQIHFDGHFPVDFRMKSSEIPVKTWFFMAKSLVFHGEFMAPFLRRRVSARSPGPMAARPAGWWPSCSFMGPWVFHCFPMVIGIMV